VIPLSGLHVEIQSVDAMQIASTRLCMAPKRLLDLSDETLQLIGTFTSGDLEIPLPAFHQHWKNIIVLFGRQNASEDLRHLRASCKRFRRVMPLSELNVDIKTVKAMKSWTWGAPDQTFARYKVSKISDETGFFFGSAC